MKLISQKRSGLFAEHRGVVLSPRLVRATIPAIEALEAAGATIERSVEQGAPVYRVTLGATMPSGLVACHVNGPPHVEACLRLDCEPECPGEHPDYWVQLDWTPCPVCGAPLVWYEAGNVPGYRVCSQPPHHHVQAR